MLLGHVPSHDQKWGRNFAKRGQTIVNRFKKHKGSARAGMQLFVALLER
jgi:hypothetical protein